MLVTARTKDGGCDEPERRDRHGVGESNLVEDTVVDFDQERAWQMHTSRPPLGQRGLQQLFRFTTPRDCLSCTRWPRAVAAMRQIATTPLTYQACGMRRGAYR